MKDLRLLHGVYSGKQLDEAIFAKPPDDIEIEFHDKNLSKL